MIHSKQGGRLHYFVIPELRKIDADHGNRDDIVVAKLLNTLEKVAMPNQRVFLSITKAIVFSAALLLPAHLALAQAPPKQASSSEADIKAALFGGVPGDRWKEGLLFEDIRPTPWLKSAANWFPRTEDLKPEEMRII
jgi:hypothetical protein